MRKGSALLIVLGMLSFMLFSGIAYSVYMRQTRLPSSFLRRTSVTRLLAKAALAEAMRDVDAAIGNDPHPGVKRTSNGNYWNHRVFTGVSTAYDGDTISTLTLEGLAYLPPSLINEVRYYSRHTPTAAWQKFRYEAGRYAYCAIDVSDYFDVNRALADRPRSSAASRRVTLAHIFEKSGNGGLHGAQAAGEAAAWDKWLEDDGKVRSVDDATDAITFNGKMPLVSLADFNLLLGKESFGMIKSPFVDYLDSNGSAFYPDAGDARDDEQAEAYRSMTFVTDSKFVEESADEDSLDANQPFDSADLKLGASRGLSAYMLGTPKSSWTDYYLNFLCKLGMCMLCDYLDEDSVPLSLTIPSCEKIPMLCAIRPSIPDLKLKIVKSGDPEKELLNADGSGKPNNNDKTIKERVVSCWFAYEIDGAGLNARAAGIEAMALFPFLHNTDQASYDVDGQVALFFTKSGDDIPLVIDGNRDPSGLMMAREPASSFNDAGILKLRIGTSAIQISGNGGATDSDLKFVKESSDLRIQDFGSVNSQLTMNNDATKNASKACILRVLRSWKQTREVNEDGSVTEWLPKQPPNDAKIVDAQSGFGILNKNGEACSDADLLGFVDDGAELELNLAVWLRIKENGGRGKAVDMVPAWMNDDSEQGLSGANGGRTATVYQRVGGDTKRIMRFKFAADGNQKVLSLKLSALDSMGEKTLVLDAPTLVCSDPRFNHNPYNWFRTSGTSVKQAWEDNINCTGNGRDGDWYMSVSNQGYLQSVYELAFLPRITDPHDGILGSDDITGDLVTQKTYADPAVFPSSFADCINAGSMWRTYHPYRVGGYVDSFDQLELAPSRGGLMVNPYSDSTEVLAAAFANTPADWRHASTNNIANTSCDLDADAFNKKYAWNAYGESSLRLPWEAILDIAEDFQADLRNQNQNWQTTYANLWSGDGNDEHRLAGIKLDDYPSASSTKITSVDRKYLYGFWRDCFAANQQLFLVFVRAEPMMMGGGVAGNAPPQLSSRAVALVWRDPSKRKSASGGSSGQDESYIPHAMRVLFYHPLD